MEIKLSPRATVLFNILNPNWFGRRSNLGITSDSVFSSLHSILKQIFFCSKYLKVIRTIYPKLELVWTQARYRVLDGGFLRNLYSTQNGFSARHEERSFYTEPVEVYFQINEQRRNNADNHFAKSISIVYSLLVIIK